MQAHTLKKSKQGEAKWVNSNKGTLERAQGNRQKVRRRAGIEQEADEGKGHGTDVQRTQEE